jgi:hypothetical protein
MLEILGFKKPLGQKSLEIIDQLANDLIKDKESQCN